jgi:indolepyruvate ferredoxin oxidoreductase beta subunit
MDETAEPVAILVCALGGEGGGVLSEWIYETAVQCGHHAQTTAIPGVAQRSGATTYYIEIDPLPASRRAARPVFGLAPAPGALDVLLSSELLETVRQIGLGLASPERTRVISSTARTLTTAEKMAPADGRLDSARLIEIVQRYARRADLIDMDALARQARTPISAVLLGALAASGALPFPRAAYEDAMRRSGKDVQANLRGFALAFDALTGASAPLPEAPPAARARASPVAAAEFPSALHEVLAHALPRLRAYQDDAYAERYLARVREVLAAERTVDPDGRNGWQVSRETARLLALWMAFDDIPRVAQMKLSAARHARVRREVNAQPGEIVRIYDFFKPGVAEVAALLPPWLARRLRAWEQARRQRGKPPLAWPLQVPSHSVMGALALRLLAALRRLRRYGSRYAQEQAAIDAWLARVRAGVRADWRLGYEIAQCARLVKGYGETYEKGRGTLEYLFAQFVDGGTFADAAARAEALARARVAAQADAQGQALAAEAARSAVPAPPREVPLRFVPRAAQRRSPVA